MESKSDLAFVPPFSPPPSVIPPSKLPVLQPDSSSTSTSPTGTGPYFTLFLSYHSGKGRIMKRKNFNCRSAIYTVQKRFLGNINASFHIIQPMVHVSCPEIRATIEHRKNDPDSITFLALFKSQRDRENFKELRLMKHLIIPVLEVSRDSRLFAECIETTFAEYVKSPNQVFPLSHYSLLSLLVLFPSQGS